MTDSDRARLVDGAGELRIPLSREQVDQFAAFGELLEEWNRRLNLTRVPPEEYVTLHFLDSLAAAKAAPLAESARLIDVGTGAGLPGVPLKITFPHLDVTLLDSTRKRLVFLDAVIDSLKLSGIRTLHARAEEAARLPAHRERYEVAIARAVARMPVLAGWLIPFVRPGGAAVALKSEGVESEVAESAEIVRRLAADAPVSIPLTLPGTDIQRRIVIIRKKRR